MGWIIIHNFVAQASCLPSQLYVITAFLRESQHDLIVWNIACDNAQNHAKSYIDPSHRLKDGTLLPHANSLNDSSSIASQ